MPLYVPILLVVLLVIGASRLRTQTLPVLRLLIAPAVFIGLGVFNLVTRSSDLTATLALWGAGAVIGFLPGAAFRQTLQVDRVQRLVRVPGSITPLLRIVVLFGLHFACNAGAAIRPDLAATLKSADIAIYGAGVGYFAGWLVRFIQAYTAAPDTDLGRTTATARA